MLCPLLFALLVAQVSSFQLSPRILNRRFSLFETSETSEATETATPEIAAPEISGVEASTPEAPPQHQLFIGNLPFDLEYEQLSEMLNAKVETGYKSLKIAKDRRTGKSRGFGYIHFEEKEQAESALAALTGMEVAGRAVKVDMSSGQRTERAPGTRFERTPQENSVFIGNLNFEVTQEAVAEMCNDLLGDGVAQRVRLLTDRDSGVLK
jgi:nucleolin